MRPRQHRHSTIGAQDAIAAHAGREIHEDCEAVKHFGAIASLCSLQKMPQVNASRRRAAASTWLNAVLLPVRSNCASDVARVLGASRK